MTLLTQIKATQLQLRKDRFSDLAAALTTLIGEAERVGKDDGNRETTDAEVVAVLKKFIKNLEETIRVAGDYRDWNTLERTEPELELLKKFLPTQYTGQALRAIVLEAVKATDAVTVKDMGKVMSALKTKHNGQYDGAEASKLIKEILTLA